MHSQLWTDLDNSLWAVLGWIPLGIPRGTGTAKLTLQLSWQLEVAWGQWQISQGHPGLEWAHITGPYT